MQRRPPRLAAAACTAAGGSRRLHRHAAHGPRVVPKRADAPQVCAPARRRNALGQGPAAGPAAKPDSAAAGFTAGLAQGQTQGEMPHFVYGLQGCGGVGKFRSAQLAHYATAQPAQQVPPQVQPSGAGMEHGAGDPTGRPLPASQAPLRALARSCTRCLRAECVAERRGEQRRGCGEAPQIPALQAPATACCTKQERAPSSCVQQPDSPALSPLAQRITSLPCRRWASGPEESHGVWGGRGTVGRRHASAPVAALANGTLSRPRGMIVPNAKLTRQKWRLRCGQEARAQAG